MKVASITDPHIVALVDVPGLTPRGNFALVKVRATPMCTEYKTFKTGKATKALGHEAAGEVAGIAQPGSVAVGDRVVVMPTYPCGKCELCIGGNYIYCQHNIKPGSLAGSENPGATYAQFLLQQDWLLAPIPPGISYEHASMACCGLGPTFGAMQRMQVDAFDIVLVTGMGPVGLGAVINGIYRGARIIAVEGQPYRADLARELGAYEVIDPADPQALARVMKLTHGKGADKCIDCTGVPAAQRLLIDACRRLGEVAFVGEGSELSIHVSKDLLRKGLTLHGNWHYNLADIPRIMQVIVNKADLLDRMITHRFPLSRLQEAFELQATGNCGKIILDPWQ